MIIRIVNQEISGIYYAWVIIPSLQTDINNFVLRGSPKPKDTIDKKESTA